MLDDATIAASLGALEKVGLKGSKDVFDMSVLGEA